MPEEDRTPLAEQPVLLLRLLHSFRLCDFQESRQSAAGASSIPHAADPDDHEQAVRLVAQAEWTSVAPTDGHHILPVARHVVNQKEKRSFCTAKLWVGHH